VVSFCHECSFPRRCRECFEVVVNFLHVCSREESFRITHSGKKSYNNCCCLTEFEVVVRSELVRSLCCVTLNDTVCCRISDSFGIKFSFVFSVFNVFVTGFRRCIPEFICFLRKNLSNPKVELCSAYCFACNGCVGIFTGKNAPTLECADRFHIPSVTSVYAGTVSRNACKCTDYHYERKYKSKNSLKVFHVFPPEKFRIRGQVPLLKSLYCNLTMFKTVFQEVFSFCNTIVTLDACFATIRCLLFP